MTKVTITREQFLRDHQGRTFSDVAKDPEQPFDALLAFFNDEHRQRRMEEAELHHDRPPLAGVVRELESQATIDRALAEADSRKTRRLRQAVGVVVRMIMEGRGWEKAGRKGSLGVRGRNRAAGSSHNTGGLSFWFVRAERYVRAEGMPFRSVRERSDEHAAAAKRPTRGQRTP